MGAVTPDSACVRHSNNFTGSRSPKRKLIAHPRNSSSHPNTRSDQISIPCCDIMTTNGHHASSTPAPTSAIDWHSVGFKVRDVNGHAQATWRDGKWSSAEFVTNPILSIHGFASCLNYGQVSIPGILLLDPLTLLFVCCVH